MVATWLGALRHRNGAGKQILLILLLIVIVAAVTLAAAVPVNAPHLFDRTSGSLVSP